MRLVFIGAPGAGKGTQAAYVRKELDIPHISTGDLIRAKLSDTDALSEQLRSYVEKGELVPDELMIDILQERLKQEDAQNGFLLDGFPRTLAQADALAEITDLDKVINIEVDREAVAKRIANRRVCKCGATYMAQEVPDSVCKVCGETTYQRPDDNYDTVMTRLSVFDEQTSPLIDYYANQGILVNIDGNAPVEEVTKSIMEVFQV